MKKGLTELVFILDRSGSMSGLEADTIGGFNSMIEKQRKEEGHALVSTVLFDHESLVTRDRIPLERVEKMTDKEYYTRGTTALLDAVGSSIQHISRLQRNEDEAERPEKTVFVITTDGMENASSEYSYKQVKRMIKEQEEKASWEFLFLGANIDAKAEAGRFGIDASHSVDYCADRAGTALNFRVLTQAISEVRMKGSVSKGWAEEIERDHKARKGGRA